MLSVVPIKTSSISSSYYLKQDGNYYIENKNDAELYQWFGKGAEKLGLVGAINGDDHVNVYSGKLPNGVEVGKKMSDGGVKGRPGYDLTFSMNKDLSLIICCSKNKELSNFFLKAHNDAVKTVLTEVEKKIQARITKNGITTYETTKNMVASLCTHFSSRAGDPEVHTHALIANATERSDGNWRALATDMSRKHGFYEMIRDNAVYFGSLYQNEMACAAKSVGFELEKVHKNGMFQIKNLPNELRDHFSKRRQQIVDIIKTLNPSVQNSKKMHDIIAQHSKAGKEKINVKDFFEKAKLDMDSYLSKTGEPRAFDKIIDDCKNKNEQVKPINEKSSALEAIKDAISHQSQFSVLLDANKIINKAISFDLGKATYKELVDAFDVAIKSKMIMQTENGKYTSAVLLEKENSIVEMAKSCVTETEKSGPQKNLNIALKGSRLCVIAEPNSANEKEMILSGIISDLEKDKKNTKILTINKSMSNQHNDYSRKKDDNIWQRLKRIGKCDLAHSINAFLHQYEAEIKMPLNNLFSKKGKEVFIVEDAQRIGLDTMQKLLSLTEKRQANIIFLKHNEGMRSQLVGNSLEIIERCKVNTINAQHYLKNTDKNKKVSNLNLKLTVDQAEGLHANETREKQDIRQASTVKTYAANYLNQHEKTLVLSQSRTAAEKLNLMIRSSLIEHGKISREQHHITAISPIFLSSQEQKHAKFYSKDAFIKIYKGKGQYDVKKIARHDLNSNKIIFSNEKGRFESVSPKDISSLIQKNEASIFYEKEMEISKGDLLCLSQSNKQSTLLNLKMGETYKILEINDKKVLLEIKSNPEKTLSIKTKKLDGLAITYDYVHSIHEKLPVSQKKTILCDLPHHTLNANVLSELVKLGNHIHIITDNKIKAEKKIHINQLKQNAVDQKLQNITSEKTPMRAALNYAIAVVGSREAAFRQEDLIKKAMSYKMASVSLLDMHSEVKNLLSERVLHMREDKFGEVIFATSEALQLEKQIIVQIRNGKNRVTELISPVSAKSFLKNTNLSQGQKEACELISTTKDRFVMIQGYAGTGKSTMLQTLIGDRTLDTLQAMLPKEVSVLALAPTHQAVIELQKKNIEAQTLKSFLIDAKSDQSNNNIDLKNKLIVVDESSMISNSDFHQLQAVIEKNNARCAYLGDIAQLSAVEAGKPSELAYISKEADIATAVMLENKRQIDPELKKIANLLMEGGSKNFSSAFDLLEKNGLMIETNPEKIIKDKNEGDQLSSTQVLAKTYATLPEGERIQTLVAAATNHDRVKINDEIRECLKKHGELSQNGISMQILDDSRLTDAELRISEHYKSGMVVKHQNEYKNVVRSDIENNLVTLGDKKGRISILSLPHLAKNDFIELYSVRNIEINPGEHIKFTKTDRDRNIRANLSLIVESIDIKNNTITAKTAQDEKHTIYFNENNDQHVDYGYCSTTHGLQAATSKSVFILSNSYNKLSNTMRQLYVALTRAQEKAIIFTDDKEKIKRQIIWNEGEKASALEAMGLLEKRQSMSNKKTQPEKITANNKTISLDAKLVEKNLALQAKEITRNILGEPNHSLSNDINWRYGSKGSLSVVVDGDKAGYFHNFETGEKGGMISLLMSELRLPFKDALEHASKLLGGAKLTKQSVPVQEKLQPTKTIVGSEKKQAYINKLISQSKPLAGTIAEKYLHGRAIEDTKNTTLRFLEHISTGGGNKDKIPFSSALMAIAHDENGKPQAIQLTYLDKKTGTKILGLTIAKRTLNSPTGAFVNLTPQIKSPNVTFVAEGVETALSIRDTTMQIKNSQVVATLGKNNIENIPLQKTASTIVLVLDNDLKNPLHDSVIKNAMKHFEENGKRVVCICPEAINNKKTDYNDLAQAGQSNKIAQDINRAFEQYKSAAQLSDGNVQTQKPKEQYRDMEKEFLG